MTNKLDFNNIFIKSLIESLIVSIPIYFMAKQYHAYDNEWWALGMMVWGYGYIFLRFIIPSSPIYFKVFKEDLD